MQTYYHDVFLKIHDQKLDIEFIQKDWVGVNKTLHVANQKQWSHDLFRPITNITAIYAAILMNNRKIQFFITNLVIIGIVVPCVFGSLC